jgi:hypothetical protein
LIIASTAGRFSSLNTSPRLHEGLIVDISDDDTITAMHIGRGEKVRLNGIDAPEKRAPEHGPLSLVWRWGGVCASFAVLIPRTWAANVSMESLKDSVLQSEKVRD